MIQDARFFVLMYKVGTHTEKLALREFIKITLHDRLQN